MPYIGKSPSAGVRQRYQYTATAGQTTFSGTDLGNLTLTYTDNNFVDVFQNGVLLKGGGNDYTATSGTSVVLATGASASDVIEIIVYDVFSVGNFYNRTDSDSRYLNVAGDTMTGSLDLNGTELILDADGDTSITADTDDQIDFKLSGTDRIAIKASGSSSVDLNTGGSMKFTVGNSDSHQFINGSDTAMTIDNSGNLIVNGTDSGGGAITAYNVANAYAPPIVELNNVATDFSAAMFELRVSSGSINTTNGRFIHCYSDNGSTTKMKVLGDGDIENVNNNYTGISDLKLKENIADSNSQWNDLKNLKVKKFSFKADKKDKADKIGVIAQDLEASNMSGLVRESKDFDSEGNDLGTTTKSVKYSILYMKAVKALQEAMARIETLETKNDALEARIKKLEDG